MGRYGRNSLAPAAVTSARILLLVIILWVFSLYPSGVIAKKEVMKLGQKRGEQQKVVAKASKAPARSSLAAVPWGVPPCPSALSNPTYVTLVPTDVFILQGCF